MAVKTEGRMPQTTESSKGMNNVKIPPEFYSCVQLVP